MSERVDSGRYEGYRMRPVDHIKAAEDLLAQAEAENAKQARVVDANANKAAHRIQIAAVHVAIAQAQMTGQMRA